MTVALKQRGCYCTTHCSLNDGVDVTGIEAITRRFLAIDLNIQVRLPLDVKNAQISNAPHLLHLVLDLKGKPLQDLLVVTEDFHRIGAFDAGKRLLDVVLDVLREIKHHPGQFLAKFLLQSLIKSSFVNLAAIRRMASAARTAQRWRMARHRCRCPAGHAGKPRGSLPDDVAKSRASCRLPVAPASNPMVGGIDARIQRLPSSNAGRNSLPSREPSRVTKAEKPRLSRP